MTSRISNMYLIGNERKVMNFCGLDSMFVKFLLIYIDLNIHYKTEEFKIKQTLKVLPKNFVK